MHWNIFRHPSNSTKITSVEKQTFALDRIRFAFQGLIDIEFKTYILLIAIRVFNMNNGVKGILAAASYIGMALAPLVLKVFTTTAIPLTTSLVIALFLFIVGICGLIATFTDHWPIFFIAIIVAKFIYKQTLPFITDIYNRNYPKERRGQIIGQLFTILALSSIIAGYFFGTLLDLSLSNYRWILLIGALSSILCGILFIRMPNGRVLIGDSSPFIQSNLLILFEDKLFSKILFLWSMMSIAFQMTLPLRTEYLANQQYGLNFSNADITLLLITVPTTTRILSAIFWGKIFDTKNFAFMKILINASFLLSIPLFFFSNNFFILAISGALSGLGYSGNLTAWQLWVTKIAPSPEKLGSYVSLDVMIMGLRDALSAGLGYYLLSHGISLRTICMIATVLIFCSTIGFFLLTKEKRLQ